MNSHQRRKKRRQLYNNKATVADWREFDRQLCKIVTKINFLEECEYLQNVLTNLRKSV